MNDENRESLRELTDTEIGFVAGGLMRADFPQFGCIGGGEGGYSWSWGDLGLAALGGAAAGGLAFGIAGGVLGGLVGGPLGAAAGVTGGAISGVGDGLFIGAAGGVVVLGAVTLINKMNPRCHK